VPQWYTGTCVRVDGQVFATVALQDQVTGNRRDGGTCFDPLYCGFTAQRHDQGYILQHGILRRWLLGPFLNCKITGGLMKTTVLLQCTQLARLANLFFCMETLKTSTNCLTGTFKDASLVVCLKAASARWKSLIRPPQLGLPLTYWTCVLVPHCPTRPYHPRE